MSDKQTEEKSIKKLINAGAEITGGAAGGIIGFLLGGSTGALIGGAGSPIVAGALKRITIEIEKRMIGPREENRIGAIIAYTIEKIQSNLSNGLKPRDDDFFESGVDERSAADEIYEAAVLAAQKEYQEKKLKYYGNLVANISFNNTFDRAQANHLIKATQELSWQQLCILAISARKANFILRNKDYKEGEQTILSQPLIFLLHDIIDLYNRGYVVTGRALLSLVDIEPSKINPQGVGAHLYNTMELVNIPDKDLLPIIAILG